MIKLARKPSTDPAQEKLRQNKALWNKEISSFINDLINFKKTMNGAPSKFFMQKSTIKDPIPADPATIIGALAGDFQELAQKGNSIIEEQIQYSKTRKKKQPKQMNLPLGQPATAPVPTEQEAPTKDLSQQLSLPIAASFETRDLLFAEGSSAISRFFARLLNPAIGGSPSARIRKYRMSMLTAAVNAYKDLEKMQVAVLGKSPESIFTASKILSKIEDNWSFLSKGFNTYKDTMPKDLPDTGGKIEPPISDEKVSKAPVKDEAKPIPDTSSEIATILSDYRIYGANLVGLSTQQMESLIRQFISATPEIKKQLIPQIISAYNNILAEANSKYHTNELSLKKVFDAAQPGKAQLETVAQDFLKKWIGKARHKLSPFDKTSAIRLDIAKLAEECRGTIDLIMDSLEKEMNVDQLEGLINKVSNELLTIRDLTRALDATIKGKGFDVPFMNLLEKGKITDFGPGLSEKQKQHLQKMLEQRQMRELTNIYYRR